MPEKNCLKITPKNVYNSVKYGWHHASKVTLNLMNNLFRFFAYVLKVRPRHLCKVYFEASSSLHVRFAWLDNKTSIV